MSEFQIKKIKNLWGIKGDLNFIRHVANWVYFCPSTDTYIRITSNEHRSYKQIESELDWMEHVNKFGVNTVKPLKSINSKAIETITEEDKIFHITCFSKAKGARAHLKEKDADFFIKWGDLTGKLHQASKEYHPKNIEKRPDWFSDELHQDIRLFRKKEDGPIYDKSIELEEFFQSLPKCKDSFGLIHADFHDGNFNIDKNGTFTLFDFDDSLHHWFIFDIAVVFRTLIFCELDQKFAQNNFLKGYLRQNQLDTLWFNHIDSFRSYRVLQIYYFAIKEIEASGYKQETIDKFQDCLDSAYNHFNMRAEHKRV